jgi:hypothetical protein
MRALIRWAVAPLSDWRLLALHLAGNALLLSAATLWLLIPEVHAWQLLFTALIGIAILSAFAWLHCGTLAHGLTPVPENLRRDFRDSIRHIPAFAILVAMLFPSMNWASNFSNLSWQISGYYFTRLPHFLQSSVGESRFHEWVQFKFAVLTWFLLPALFLPFLSASSSSGFSRRGFRAALRTYARGKYWLAIAIAALIGVWLPYLLASWAPLHGLREETISMVLRLLTGYVLAVLVWLMSSAAVGSFVRAVLSVEDPGGKTAG